MSRSRVRWLVTITVFCGIAAFACVGSARAADPQSSTRELIEVLKSQGQLTGEQYQSLLARVDAEEKATKPWPDWLDRFTLFGDARVRGEAFFQDEVTARYRSRLRARFGTKLNLGQELEAGLRLATGDPSDPISTNQSMTDLFTRKPVALDQAFIQVKPGKSLGSDRAIATITGGKFATPTFRPKAVMTSEVIFDDDLNPEGFHEIGHVIDSKEGTLRKLDLHALQWSLEELGSGADAWIFGGQVVSEVALGSNLTLTAAVTDYYVSQANRIAQELNSNSSLLMTNSIVLKDGTIVPGGVPFKAKSDNPVVRFTGGFNLINPSIQLAIDTGSPPWPLVLAADLVVNTEANGGDDLGYWLGVGIGKTKAAGDWAFSAAWAHTETNAVVSSFSYSDFGRSGGTNAEGAWVKIDFMPISRLTLTAKNHFVWLIDKPEGKSNDTVYRLQADAAVAF